MEQLFRRWDEKKVTSFAEAFEACPGETRRYGEMIHELQETLWDEPVPLSTAKRFIHLEVKEYLNEVFPPEQYMRMPEEEVIRVDDEMSQVLFAKTFPQLRLTFSECRQKIHDLPYQELDDYKSIQECYTTRFNK